MAVNAVCDETMRGRLAVSDILLSRAADPAADLIVAGGYHHSQLRAPLVGGGKAGVLHPRARGGVFGVQDRPRFDKCSRAISAN